jgi:hypothetical protein
MPIMLLLPVLFLHYRILAKLTVLMNTVEVPLLLTQGGITIPDNQAGASSRINESSHSPLPKIRRFHNNSVSAWTFRLSIHSFA